MSENRKEKRKKKTAELPLTLEKEMRGHTMEERRKLLLVRLLIGAMDIAPGVLHTMACFA